MTHPAISTGNLSRYISTGNLSRYPSQSQSKWIAKQGDGVDVQRAHDASIREGSRNLLRAQLQTGQHNLSDESAMHAALRSAGLVP